MLDLLERIEATPETQAFILTRHDERTVGEIVSSDRHVCMVTLAEDQLPLSSRLRALDTPLSEAIRDALAKARLDGRPLGEALMALGAQARDVVRRALRDQFIEGIAMLARFEPDDLVEVVLSSSRRIPTLLTAFPPLDVYWGASSHFGSAVMDAAKRCFDELGSEVDRAALIACGPETGGASMLVGTRGFWPTSIAEVVKVGCLAERILRPPAFVASSEEPSVVSLGRADDIMLAIASTSHRALLVGVRPEIRAKAIALVRQTAPGCL